MVLQDLVKLLGSSMFSAMRATIILLIIFPSLVTAASFLPGLSPTDFIRGERLEVYARTMRSQRNKVGYDYFSLPFCRGDIAFGKRENRLDVGGFLMGERLRLTAYKVEILQEARCVVACARLWKKRDLAVLTRRIREEYRVGMVMDSMPAVERLDREGDGGYLLGWPIGYVKDGRSYVNNHLRLEVWYHKPDELERMGGSRAGEVQNVYRVVGFDVTAMSVDHAYQVNNNARTGNVSCPTGSEGTEARPMEVLAKGEMQQILFTYDVRFKESEVKWVTRWDPLLKVSRDRKRVQLLSVTNSFMMAVFLTATLGIVMERAVRRDFARYGFGGSSSYSSVAMGLAEDFDDGITEIQSGWKMLRRDVFRSPPAGELLVVLCGSGMQLVLMAFFTLLCALIGLVSPGRRGNLLAAFVFLFPFSSSIAGYVAAHLYKSIGGTRWRTVTLGVALVPPTIAFAVFFIINLFLWIKGSIDAAPFLIMFIFLGMWLGASVPLAFVGTYFGYKRKAYDFHVRSSSLSRQIPPQPSFLTPPFIHLITGLLPFGIVCMELRIVLHSIWQNELYYMFGFLFLVFLLASVICAECSIFLSYLKLCNEDYHWWWDAFWASATSGIYIFAYSCYYLVATPGVDVTNFVSSFLFLGYAGLFSMAFSVGSGSIGLLSALWFVRRIYSGIQD